MKEWGEGRQKHAPVRVEDGAAVGAFATNGFVLDRCGHALNLLQRRVPGQDATG